MEKFKYSKPILLTIGDDGEDDVNYGKSQGDAGTDPPFEIPTDEETP